MPIYSYKCKKCGKIFDSFQRADENSNIRCIYCDSEAQRIFSPVGIILKGSGFYTTDYRSSHKKSCNNNSISKDNWKDSKKSEIQSSGKREANVLKDKEEKKLK